MKLWQSCVTTDYGRTMKPFSAKSQTFWADNFLGIFGVFFGRFISTHFGTVSPCLPLINHYFYRKLSLYSQIPNIYLGLGFEFEFEFGPQRIRNLAIVCLQSVCVTIVMRLHIGFGRIHTYLHIQNIQTTSKLRIFRQEAADSPKVFSSFKFSVSPEPDERVSASALALVQRSTNLLLE